MEFFPSPISEPFLQELLAPCSPQLLIFTWFLVTAFGMFGFCTHCKWQSPSSHLWWLKRKQRLHRGPRGPVGLESSKPSWASPTITHSLPRHPAWPRRSRPLPRQPGSGPHWCPPAHLAPVVSGAEASDRREHGHEVFFFSLSF